MTATVNGVLLAWRRLDNLSPIVGGMLDGGCEEVAVWSNRSVRVTTDIRHQLAREFGSRVLVVGCGENIYTLGRYVAAWHYRDSLIATCDDDCLVHNWPGLIDACRDGTNLVANIKTGHYVRYVKTGEWSHEFKGGTAYETLVGWGAVFPWSMLKRLDLYKTRFDVDELLKRKADRFFTMLQARKHDLIPGHVFDLPGASDRMALYRQPDHYRLTREAQKRAIQLLEEEAACTGS